jgi:hypothetical protein
MGGKFPLLMLLFMIERNSLGLHSLKMSAQGSSLMEKNWDKQTNVKSRIDRSEFPAKNISPRKA